MTSDKINSAIELRIIINLRGLSNHSSSAIVNYTVKHVYEFSEKKTLLSIIKTVNVFRKTLVGCAAAVEKKKKKRSRCDVTSIRMRTISSVAAEAAMVTVYKMTCVPSDE